MSNVRLILFKSFFFILFFIQNSYAGLDLAGPKVAKIVVPRAIVYAEEYLLTPLGYIPNGKLIAVGNPRRVNKDIVPTIISGRLAYLELSDIEFLDDSIDDQKSKIGSIAEHDVDVILKRPEEKLNENNSILFLLSRFNAGPEVNAFFFELEDKYASWYTSLHVGLVHRKPLSRLFYGFGWEFDYINVGEASFKKFIMSPSIGLTLMQNPVFSVDAFFNLDFSTGFNIVVDNNHAKEPNGFLWGPQVGVRLIAAPTTKYRLYGQISYRKYQVYGLEGFRRTSDNYPTDDYDVTGYTKMYGIGIGAGFTFDI